MSKNIKPVNIISLLLDDKAKHWERRLLEDRIVNLYRYGEVVGYQTDPFELYTFCLKVAEAIRKDLTEEPNPKGE